MCDSEPVRGAGKVVGDRCHTPHPSYTATHNLSRRFTEGGVCLAQTTLQTFSLFAATHHELLVEGVLSGTVLEHSGGTTAPLGAGSGNTATAGGAGGDSI